MKNKQNDKIFLQQFNIRERLFYFQPSLPLTEANIPVLSGIRIQADHYANWKTHEISIIFYLTLIFHFPFSTLFLHKERWKTYNQSSNVF